MSYDYRLFQGRDALRVKCFSGAVDLVACRKVLDLSEIHQTKERSCSRIDRILEEIDEDIGYSMAHHSVQNTPLMKFLGADVS